jgi:hypothetical protein
MLTSIGRPLCTALSNIGTQPYNWCTFMNQEAAKGGRLAQRMRILSADSHDRQGVMGYMLNLEGDVDLGCFHLGQMEVHAQPCTLIPNILACMCLVLDPTSLVGGAPSNSGHM